MQETRRARLESVIRDELSMMVSRELKDPRVPPVTITQVEVTPDGGQATVFLMILGARPEEDPNYPEKMAETLKGLSSAAGFLRRHLAKVLNVRHIPALLFREDKGLANATRVYELLREISNEDKKSS